MSNYNLCFLIAPLKPLISLGIPQMNPLSLKVHSNGSDNHDILTACCILFPQSIRPAMQAASEAEGKGGKDFSPPRYVCLLRKQSEWKSQNCYFCNADRLD